MYNYHLNRRKSSTFVNFYEENGKKLNVHYGDKSIVEADNATYIKNNLNSIQEKQLEDFNNIDYFCISNYDNPSKLDNFRGMSFVFGLMGAVVLTIITGLLFLAEGPLAFKDMAYFWGVDLLATVPLLGPAIVNAIRYLPAKLANRKFNLFMQYKDEINSRVEKTEEYIDEKELNPTPSKRTVIQNLSINDVHFMKYSELKKMTNAIDNAVLEEDRFEKFGVERGKILVKERQYKR